MKKASRNCSFLLIGSTILLLLAQSVSAATLPIRRVSIGVGGVATTVGATAPSVSDNGEVVFESESDNLVMNDLNDQQDIFFAASGGEISRVNLSYTGGDAMRNASAPRITSDGRYVVFRSSANNLVTGDTNNNIDIFVRDMISGTTERINVSSTGMQANNSSMGASISNDGRYVVFISRASNLVANDTNGVQDVFVRDRVNGTTERVNVSSSGQQIIAEDFFTDSIAIASGGRYVVFTAGATGLVANDTNGVQDVFVRDRVNGTTERVNVSSTGMQADGGSFAVQISDDGRYVAFNSYATNLVPNDTNGVQDVFVRDRVNGTTERVSVDAGGVEAEAGGSYPGMSADGRYIVFGSANLLGDVTDNYTGQVYVRDVWSGVTLRVSETTDGIAGEWDSFNSSISANGRYIVFESWAQIFTDAPNNPDREAEIYIAENPFFNLVEETPATGEFILTKTLLTTGQIDEGDTVEFGLSYTYSGTVSGDIVFIDIPGTGLSFVSVNATGSVTATASGNSVMFWHTGASETATGTVTVSYLLNTGAYCAGTTGAYSNTLTGYQSVLEINAYDEAVFTVTCEMPQQSNNNNNAGGGGGSRGGAGFAIATALSNAVTNKGNNPLVITNTHNPHSPQNTPINNDVGKSAPNKAGSVITVIAPPVIPVPVVSPVNVMPSANIGGVGGNGGAPTQAPTVCPDGELQDAFAYAASYSVTTMPDCYSARLEDTLQRKHAAKMIVNFAINVLGRSPDITRVCEFTDIDQEDAEMQQYIKMACQLGLMGLVGNGQTTTSFNPSGLLDKAQFSTILSRALYGDAFNTSNECRYCAHTQALYEAGIIKMIDDMNTPFLRGRAMLMLQRVKQ